MTDETPWSRRWLSAGAGLVVMLTALLVVSSHVGRSAWTDEAWVIDFADQPTLADTWRVTLAAHQPAAPGYMAMMHVVASVADNHLWLYRLPSAVFGMAMLGLIWLWASHWSHSPTLGMVAPLVLLWCPILQRYMTEIKQYLPAAAITIGLIAATDCWLKRPSGFRVIIWTGLAITAVVVSFSGWFAVAGTATVILGGCLIRPIRKRALLQAVCCFALVAVVAAVAYLGYMRHIVGSSVLHHYWSHRYLPHDLSLPGAAWDRGVSLIEEAWYLYNVPAGLMLFMAAVGGVIWWVRQPIAALAAAAVLVVTVLANLVHAWPSGIRINLPLIVIGHLCLIALPLGLLGWGRDRWAPGANSRNKQEAGSEGTWLFNHGWDLGGLVIVLFISSGLIHETRAQSFEVAAVGRLLDEVQSVVDEQDLVVMDPAAYVNLQQRSQSLGAAEIRLGPWPKSGKMAELYLPMIQDWTQGQVFIAAGHHNDAMAAAWSDLGQSLLPLGRFDHIWSHRLVALYVFDPHKSATGNGHR